MSRLLRIVCDNPACASQVEKFAAEWMHELRGMDDTPQGWYRLTQIAPAGTDMTKWEPLFFCSAPCVRAFTGDLKHPETRTDGNALISHQATATAE